MQITVLFSALLLLYESGLSLHFHLADWIQRSRIEQISFETLTQQERMHNLQALREVASLKRATAQSHFAVAQYAWNILRSTVQARGDQQLLICTIYQGLSKAESLEPLNSWYLLKQAELKLQLRSQSCPEFEDNRTIADLVNTAISFTPKDPVALFLAAQILFQNPGTDDQAAEYLRQYLSLPIKIETDKLLYVFSRLKTDSDVERIVPVILPRIALLASELRIRRPLQHQNLKEAFARCEQQALENMQQVTENPEQSGSAQDMLTTLLQSDPISKIRQEVDKRLAELLVRSSKGQLADYLLRRSDLVELDIVRGFHRRDSRPEKLAAARWGSHQELALDSGKSSLVFFLGANQQVKLVELRSRSPWPAAFLSGLELYGSQDNNEWRRIGIDSAIFPGELGKLHLLAIPLDASNFRYWKLHFAGVAGQNQIRNELSDVVRVYGIKRAVSRDL